MSRQRPTSCPEDAWWSDEDQEWVHGDHNADGQLVGLVRYWTEDGVYLSECEHELGKPHGYAKRFFADGAVEQECNYVWGHMDGVRSVYRPTGVHDSVVVYECTYEDGYLVGTCFRTGKGLEVDAHDGTPIPPRPKGVPRTASPLGEGWLYMGNVPSIVKL